MTVNDLIAQLKKFPGEAEVLCLSAEDEDSEASEILDGLLELGSEVNEFDLNEFKEQYENEDEFEPRCPEDAVIIRTR